MSPYFGGTKVNNAPRLVTTTVLVAMNELTEERTAAPEPATEATHGRDWRWWVGGLGRVLIVLGLLVLGFVVYQLWGTGIEHARAQSSLEKEFGRQMASTVPPTTQTVPPSTVPPTSSPPSTAAVPTTAAPTTAPAATVPPRPDFADGDAVAKLEIPRMGVSEIVVSGVGVDDLKKGPGHYPETPLPGEPGNAAIAGHRTTYGAPFFDIDKLKPGDDIVATTYAGRFVYKVTGSQIVSPSDVSVLENTPDDRITLTSCDPKYSATNRIIVTGVFDASSSSPLVDGTAPPPTTVAPAPPDTGADSGVVSTPATTTPTTATSAAPPTTAAAVAPAANPPAGLADESFQLGWFDDAAAWPDVIVWGLAGAAVVVGAWWLGRRTRRWIGWLAAVVPFVVLLYFFYENVNRLLPPNL
jgi:sortase A